MIRLEVLIISNNEVISLYWALNADLFEELILKELFKALFLTECADIDESDANWVHPDINIENRVSVIIIFFIMYYNWLWNKSQYLFLEKIYEIKAIFKSSDNNSYSFLPEKS